ncbi:MAG: hypothetical protein J7577_11915 [Sphingobacteriaceae bacterium]|nr:hypothetical protein [Sphingobacteriaceae bacterium]
MNLNNLQNLQQEMAKLGFSEKLSKQMEEKMVSDLPYFVLKDRVPGDREQVDMKLHFKQSTQSDYYYLNKYEVSLATGKGLEEGQKCWIITGPEQKGGKNMAKEFADLRDGIDVFKKLEVNANLVVGKSLEYNTTIALREGKEMKFVDKDFRQTFYAPDLKQTFWVDRGEGFTVEQAKNLVQGRAVYRDNLLSANGVTYKAWVTLDKDKPRDRVGNLVLRQFNDPGYGFDLKASLNEYRIKELSDSQQMAKVEESLRNGNRPLITVEKDGKEVKMLIEAAVRYNRINFFDQKGGVEKREQFEKKLEPVLSQVNGKEKGKAKGMELGV